MCSLSGVSEDGQDTEGVMRFGKTKVEIDNKGCYGCGVGRRCVSSYPYISQQIPFVDPVMC